MGKPEHQARIGIRQFSDGLECDVIVAIRGHEMVVQLPVCGLCSLIPTKNSLFFEIVSLLICVGNCARSHCGAAVSSHAIGARSLKIARFPVKFPVSREFAWRRERSALRRQPGIPRFREFPSLDVKGPLNAGFSHR